MLSRLPKNNSLEALISLQDAWDYVDSYDTSANMYKVNTKISYIVLLVAGVLISIIAISANSFGYNCSSSTSQVNSDRYGILCLALLITSVTGYVNFMNPAVRWHQLRGKIF